MNLIFVVISIIFGYFSPAEISPELASYHLQQFILFPAILGTVVLAAGSLRLQWPQHLLIPGFWFAVVMSRASSGWLGGAINSLWTFGVVATIYFLVSLNCYTTSRIRTVCATLVGSAAVMAVQAIVAFHTGYNADKLVSEGRVQGWGFVGNANDFAQFLVVSLALLGAFWKRGAVVRNFLLVSIGGLLLYTTFLTYSRGAVIGLAVIFCLTVSRKMSKAGALALAALLGVSLVALGFGGGRDFSMTERSAAGRVIAWGTGINLLRAHPIFGVGYGLFTNFNDLTAHNSWVLCFAELGLFGYFFWFALLLVTGIRMERLNSVPVDQLSEPSVAGLLRSLRAAFYSFLATSWFLSRTYTLTLYILLALCGTLCHFGVKDPKNALGFALRGPKNIPWIRLTLACEIVSVIIIYVSIRVRTF